MTKHNNVGNKYGKALRAYRTEILDVIYDFNDPTCLDGIYEECIIDIKHAWIHGNLEKLLLNGAHDWLEYSRGGSSLVATDDIIERTGIQPREGHEDDMLVIQAAYLEAAYVSIIIYYCL